MLRCFKLLCVGMVLVLMISGCRIRMPDATEPSMAEATTTQQQETYALRLGCKMPDLTVTTAQGEHLLLSELLQEKKMVMLNFWYADCYWCVREFPVMEVAYQDYKQDLEIIALSPYDPKETIVDFQAKHSLSFPMATCNRDLVMGFGIGSYPTSVVIDRNGLICLIHSGAITETQVFRKLFETFTAEDYTPRVYQSINEIL